MGHRLLLIDEGGFPLAATLSTHGLDAEVLRCGPCEWTSLITQTSPPERLDLVVAAVDAGQQWHTFFQTLRGRTVRPPILAIVADTSGPDLLRLAACAADDFIVWSDNRASELCERV